MPGFFEQIFAVLVRVVRKPPIKVGAILLFGMLVGFFASIFRLAIGTYWWELLGTLVVCWGAQMSSDFEGRLPKIIELARRFALGDRGYTRTKDLAVSLTYLWYLREKGTRVKLALLFAATSFLIASLWFENAGLVQVAAVLVAYAAFLAIKEAVVEYRVSNGLFGGTESEVRDLIKFIIDHAEKIDFTGGDGNRLPPFVAAQERLEQGRDGIPGKVAT